jgi:hypothetical protein
MSTTSQDPTGQQQYSRIALTMSVEMCLTFPIERQPNQAALNDVLVMLHRLESRGWSDGVPKLWHGIECGTSEGLISRDKNGCGWRGFVTLKAGCKPSRRGLARSAGSTQREGSSGGLLCATRTDRKKAPHSARVTHALMSQCGRGGRGR